MKISIVIPTLNEEQNLPIVLEELKRELDKRNLEYEIIIVDGYSEDKTVDMARSFNTKVIFDKRGKGSSLRKGMDLAKGDIIITIDADCSNISSEMGLLIEGINSGFDICMGSRFIQGGGTDDMEWYRKIGNKFFIFFVNLFWKMNYSDLCYGYRSFNKKAAEKLLPHLSCDGFGIETEIAIKAVKLRLNVLEVPSYEKARKYGKGKLKTFRDGWRVLMTIIKELF